MANANEPAYPGTELDQRGFADAGIYAQHRGLTKREAFAMAAMQGLLASGFRTSEVLGTAVWYADQLLAELEKTP